MTSTLTELLDGLARRGERTAVLSFTGGEHGAVRLSYADLDARARRLAGGMRRRGLADGAARRRGGTVLHIRHDRTAQGRPAHAPQHPWQRGRATGLERGGVRRPGPAAPALHHSYPFIVGMLVPLAVGATVVLPSGVSGAEIRHALAEGYLWITGRAKEMIVLPDGKNIAPEEIEAVYAESPYIAEIAVLER